MNPRVRVIDSHTGGEPTRMVLEGGPDLGPGSAAARLERFRDRHDDFRTAILNEPRGFEAIVGAMLCEPQDPAAAAQVIFFNNAGFLGMCGHGTIGVAETLRWLDRLDPGTHRFETPAGDVEVNLREDHSVEVANVRSYRSEKAVRLDVPGIGAIHGDVAWGGNWFFLVEDHGQDLRAPDIVHLTAVSAAIRDALRAAGVRGTDGTEIDHIELFGPPTVSTAHSRNFVLCPGREYDRSPCGTGTSAKLACLAADGKLQPGEIWRQESIVGSVFDCSYTTVEGGVVPRIVGRAWVTGDATLVFEPDDPYAGGIVL